MAIVSQHPAIAAALQTNKTPGLTIADSKSQVIREVKYEDSGTGLGNATVTFASGSTRTFLMVPRQTMENWLISPSKGKYFAEMVKGKFTSSGFESKSVGKKVSKNNEKKGGTHG